MGKFGPKVVRVFLLCLGLCLIFGAFLLSDTLATTRAVEDINKQGNASAELLASSLERELEKFRLATLVLAQDPDARAALTSNDQVRWAAFNAKLGALSKEMGASAIFLIDATGQSLAASNWDRPETFVGQNYLFRSYFRDALRTGHHEQYALGILSKRPGLYIAQRLQIDGQPIGVIVTKVEFDRLEAEWRKAGVMVFATNADGVILVTSTRDWRFKTVQPLSQTLQNKMLRDLDYGTSPLDVLPQYKSGQVATRDDTSLTAKAYREAVKPLPNGWRLHVLSDTRASINAAVANSRIGFLAVLLALILLSLVAFYVRRNAAFKAERNLAKQQREMTERLVQLNKMATLGQIAAGVGHEINQPLAALTAYTRNSVTFLERGQHESVHENLNRISELASRIGAITTELTGFSRKSTGAIGAVSLTKVVEGALLLLRDRIATTQARVTKPEGDTMVMAEAVRLEQVLVNVMQNALDAGEDNIAIDLSVERVGSFVELSIADNGPGLSQAARDGLFQPFSTTKREGLGLGLVISRDIIADFGGELVAASPETGARFIVRLRPAA